MTKAVKVTLWGLAGVVVLLAIGAAILAATFDPNRYKPEIERLVREQTGRTLKLGGNLQLAFFPSLGVRVAKVSLTERASDAEFVSLESAHAAVKLLPLLRGNVVIDTVRISGLKAQVIKGKDGKFNFDDLLGDKGEKEQPAKPAPAKAAGGVPLQLAISGVRIERSSVTYRDLFAGNEFVLSDFRLSTGRIAEQAQGKLQLGATLKGTKPQLDARLDLNAEYRFDLAKKMLAAPKFSVELDVASPELPMQTVRLAITGSAQADLGKQTMSAELTTRYGDSTIQAKLGLAKFTPASYLFDINVDRLDLDRYLPKEPAKPAAPAAKPAAEKETDTPIDLSFLKDLNANGKLHVEALQLRGLKMANVRADVKAANGRMDVAPHSASLYEGAVAGELSLQADGNRIALKETLSGVAIGALLHDVAKTDRLEGKGNLALDVTGSGKTVGAMKKALAGTAKINLKDGALKGIDIEAALRKTDSLLRRPAAGERTGFSVLSASFVIKDGVARNEDLDLKAPAFGAGGRGAIDIGNSRLDYLFKASLVGPSKVTVPVRVTGPFAEPDYEIDYGAVASDIAKTKVRDRVKDGLKGLLGR